MSVLHLSLRRRMNVGRGFVSGYVIDRKDTAMHKEQTTEFPSRTVRGDKLAIWLFLDVGQVVSLSHLKTQGNSLCLGPLT
jgi:hypothetical protein